MSVRFTKTFGAMSATLALVLAGCSSEDNSAESANSQAELTTTYNPVSEESYPDLTYELGFDLTDGSAWPATVLGYPIRTQQELQIVSDTYPGIGGWVANFLINQENADFLKKPINFRDVQEYGAEICSKYSTQELIDYIYSPYNNTQGSPAEEQANLAERYDEYFDFSKAAPDVVPEDELQLAFISVIYAGWCEDMPNLNLELNSHSITQGPPAEAG